MSSIMNDFGLTAKQAALLFSIEFSITMEDILLAEARGGSGRILKTNDITIRRKWLQSWYISTSEYLKNLPGGMECSIASRKEDLARLAEEVEADSAIRTPMYLILLESILYVPYYPIEKSELDNKQFKKIEFLKPHLKEYYDEIAKLLKVDQKYVKQFQSAYSSAVNGITGKWIKLAIGSGVGVLLLAVTAGAASSIIAPFFAASGLYGAAAVASGLAALGGGAVAAGGMGMAGGFAVLVGGGALLGGVAGSGVGLMLATSPDITLSQAARLEVVLKEIVLGVQKDFKMMQEILQKQNETIFNLKVKYKEMETQSNKNKKDMEQLKKSIEILEKSLKRNMGA